MYNRIMHSVAQYQRSSQLLYSILISNYVNLCLIAFISTETVIMNRSRRYIHCCNDVTFIAVSAIRPNHMQLTSIVP